MALAPRLVYEVYDKLAEIISHGLTVVVIEQKVEIAHHA
jgi:ABC-type branched-subunit amino acid transport system ATPase component